MSKTHFLGISLYFLGAFRRYLHPQLHFPLLSVFLQRNAVVVLGISLNSDGGGVELFGPEFLYLLDLVLEVLVLVLGEHVLELVVEILLAVLEVDLESIAVQRVCVRIC